MPLKKKNRFKPIFKPLIRLRENVQHRRKIFNFKKKKWERFLKICAKKLRRYNKFKSFDHYKYFVTKHRSRGNSYNKRFRNTLQAGKKLRLFYGNLLKKYLKKKIHLTLKKKKLKFHRVNVFLSYFEKRLDTVIYRAKFAPTLQSARQLISHGKVCVNKVKINNKAYSIEKGDIVSLNFTCFNLYENHIIKTIKWPVPPKHLLINYKTLQIIFLDSVETSQSLFPLKLHKILVEYPMQ